MAWDGYPEKKWAGYPWAFWLGVVAYLLIGCHQDELYRRIQLLAVSTAAGVVVIISFTLGMLEEFAVVPHVSANWAGQVMILAWAIAAGVLGRRYR